MIMIIIYKSSMKYKKYNPPSSKLWRGKERMKKTLFASASSGIVAGMLIVGSSTVFADTTNYSASAYTQNASGEGMHMMHRWNGTSKAGALATQLGLDPYMFSQELKSGKTVKQILQENGIV